MKFTKSGEKATRLRGHNRAWLLQSRSGYLRIIEVKPGVSIEDIDTRIAERHPNETWEERITISKISKADGADYTGWIVACGPRDSGPIANKTDALRNARYMLADIAKPYWED